VSLKGNDDLDSSRAKQIMSSPDNITVLFQGHPVWISALHADQFAEIMYIDTREKIQVPINKLEEI